MKPEEEAEDLPLDWHKEVPDDEVNSHKPVVWKHKELPDVVSEPDEELDDWPDELNDWQEDDGPNPVSDIYDQIHNPAPCQHDEVNDGENSKANESYNHENNVEDPCWNK